MMILQAFVAQERFGRGFGPFWRTHAELHTRVLAFVLGCLIAFNSCDLRWTLVAMVLRLFGAAWAFGERQFARWAHSVLRRAWQGARFAAELSDADSMVAAGGG